MSDDSSLIHRAHEALALSDRRVRLYEAVLSSTPDLVYIFDLQHRFLYANRALLEMWGRTWEESIGRTCLELGYEQWHAEMHDREIEQAIATRLPVRGEVPFSGTNGRRIYDYIFVPVIGMNGEVEAVAGTTRDVTERYGVEKALRESEQFNRTILDNSPDCVKVLDIEGRLERMNVPGMCVMEIDDFSPYRGRNWCSLWPAETQREIAVAVDRARNGETVRFESFCPTARGTAKWWDVIVTPVRNHDGEVFRLISVSRDVSHNKAAEQQLSAAKAAAEAASKAKDDFLAALSHELRTPLNPVLLLAREAEQNEALSPEVRADFATIRRNVELEARLIDDLLDLTRISHGKLRLTRQVLNAHELLRACLGFIRPEIEVLGLHLSLSLEAAHPWVEADPVRLQQVFWNVLRNAVKFTPAAGTVTLRTSNVGERLVVQIIDTGIGIEADDLTTIFDAFRQGQDGSNLGGLGLGLAITRKLVEQHHGEIRASSAGRGFGATFELSFPVAAQPVPKSAPPHLSTEATTTAPPSSRRILLVEDHEDTRELLHRMLVRRGHHVSPTGSIRGARALIEASDFDVIVSDLGLPDGDGTEVLRDFPERGPMPFCIAMTGYGMEEDFRRTQAAGFGAHLTKPVDMTELDRLLNTAPSNS